MFRVMLMGELPAIICFLCVENGVARNVQCLHMQSHRNDAYVQRHFYCMNVIQCVLISGSRQKSVEANGPKFFFFFNLPGFQDKANFVFVSSYGKNK